MNFTESSIRGLRPGESKYDVLDRGGDHSVPGLMVRVEVSGTKTFYFRYTFSHRRGWYPIGPAAAIEPAAARMIARKLWGDVANGRNPQAERKAERSKPKGITHAQLHHRYVEEEAKKNNKSWHRGNSLMIAHVLRPWGNRIASEITRAEVRELIGKISDRATLANSVLAAISAVFTWAIKQDVIALNPCKGIDKNPTQSRERVLSESERRQFWKACESVHPVKAAALKTILLTGQRPVSCMRREHLRDGCWWEQPGKPMPELGWPGTKSGSSHRVWISEIARGMIGEGSTGFVFAGERGAVSKLDQAMREISGLCNFNPPVRPHDLRRTAGTKITGRGHGREAMDRILHHEKKGVTDIYDRHDYSVVDRRIMEDVANAMMAIVEGDAGDNVVAARFGRAK
jgi:integrase